MKRESAALLSRRDGSARAGEEKEPEKPATRVVTLTHVIRPALAHPTSRLSEETEAQTAAD